MASIRSTLHLLLVIMLVLQTNAQIQLPIRLLTHNIRYATTSPFTGEKPWSDRRPLILNELLYNTLHNQESFICMQEVLHQQLLDIMADLNSVGGAAKEEEWSYIGVGRDDGKTKGEYSPIVFRKAVWGLDGWKTVWLSETPNVPGKGWDAASVRIVTVGTFVHKSTGRKVVGACTHLDDQGEVSRRESAKLILKTIEDVTRPANSSSSAQLPVFLAGDLNSAKDGDAYKILNGEGSGVKDVREVNGGVWKYGDQSTFSGFEGKRKDEIDYLFVGPRAEGKWKVKGYTVLPNRFEDGVYNSDHKAVVGDLVLGG